MATPDIEAIADDGVEEPEGLDKSDGSYPIDNVLIRTEQRTLGEVVRRIQQGRYIMDPEFQRDFVWLEDKQSRLIESLIMRIPLPVFYLAENPDGRLVVVDGLQRLTTFQRFIEGKLVLGLKDSELNGHRFSELPTKLQNRIEDAQLILYIIDAKVPDRARLDIFERVNGGVPLSRQQMRNCIYQGPATALLKELASSAPFQRATTSSLDWRTMRDREAINRFIAFDQLGVGAYRGDMDQFLADALKHVNRMKESEIDDMRGRFLASMTANREIFGNYAFRKHQSMRGRRSVLNIALFDVQAVLFAAREASWWSARAETIRAGFYELMRDAEFMDAISLATNSRSKVELRFHRFAQLLSMEA